tara:strand:- start:84270 stop:84812 length:543 start_codon:yes stop_codon:yes gene_type:complete
VKLAATIFSFAVAATPVSASDLAERAAKLFGEACLNQSALSLGAGSTVADAHEAGKVASQTFVAYSRKGLTQNLVGEPQYTVSADKRSGDFFCHVSSKDLGAADLEKYFAWLSQTAGQGKKPTKSGPAKWDDGTQAYIAGKRAEFVTNGRTLLLEAYHFNSAKGPVGSFSVHIKHTVSGS